jgi:hypothetical protein
LKDTKTGSERTDPKVGFCDNGDEASISPCSSNVARYKVSLTTLLLLQDLQVDYDELERTFRELAVAYYKTVSQFLYLRCDGN